MEQNFTVVLFVNHLTPRVKPLVIQGFLTFDSVNRAINGDHSSEKLWSRTLLWWCLFFNFVIRKKWYGFAVWSEVTKTKCKPQAWPIRRQW